MSRNNSCNGDNHERTAKDLELLRSIAFDLVHENADLKNRLDERERELNLLYTVIGRVNVVMEAEEVKDIIIELTMSFFPTVGFCMIALFDDDAGLAVRYAARGGSTMAEKIAMPFPMDDSIKWDEVVATEEWNDFFERREEIKGLQSTFIPLELKSRQIGFIMLGRPRGSEYDEGEWRLLRTMANYCSVSIDNSKLYQLAITDTLTGLFNRRYFDNRLEREMERARERGTTLALLMLDLDHFKRINDTHGHPAGDQVLRELADRMLEGREDGRIVCRVGGEEFAILLPGIEFAEAESKAETIRDASGSRPYVFDADCRQITQTITISIGVAVFPKDGDNPEALVNKADQALYLAKALGRNRVVSHSAARMGKFHSED
ncbi:MAG TPA: GGDEF domain-containing protein [bacterium]|nr:GGDEF domain-containing protein [bacterium]